MKDKMTSLERMTAYNKGESIDRLPCNPNIANGAARVIGCKISEFKGNGKLIAKAQVEAYRMFGHDGVRIFTDLYVQAEAMGAKVYYPLDDTANLETPAINDVSEIEKLQPANPYKDGHLPAHLEAAKILIDQIGLEVPCSGGIVGPFTNAFFLIGIERMTKLILKNPEAVHKLCELSLETCKRYAEAFIKIGLTPTISEPMSSTTIVSPKQFKEFSFPYLKRLIDFILSKGKTVTLHICGKTEKIWEDMVASGANCLSIDNVASLYNCKNKVGDKVRIMGNVDPSSVMYDGTIQDVRQATIECVKQAYDSPKGYIICSGCSLPINTPFANIQAMMDTAREIGYPIKIDALPIQFTMD
ncbi:uroporphyrinogen decarboxylase family protein [Desulfosporosinus sp. OT]|uniref:uroporphyrinogen decarboxylase family protein n=1 Tax=Desulfosporosinus sp. OT TaxID=913865 RepID=UPI000223B1DA|nr:uroporphyrinogen decarboxylase family protein [Desulfosporosinus sp. OT]EGW40216.1 uroporphyrinogen decarboxylase family protein [Desulfosporosinus sp. OT]